MTYRNSCLAVLVGDVGKSSSLQMKIQEKAGNKKEADKHLCINQLQHDPSSGKLSYFPLLQFSFKKPFKLLFQFCFLFFEIGNKKPKNKSRNTQHYQNMAVNNSFYFSNIKVKKFFLRCMCVVVVVVVFPKGKNKKSTS